MSLLHNKNAVIYGAGGSLGGAIAKALAAQGAQVFLTGRSESSLAKTAEEISKAGGRAQVDIVDVFDEPAVTSHIETVYKAAGSVDISYNAAGIYVKQDIPLIDLTMEDFVTPITLTMQSNFITAKAAGRIMKKQGSGVILTLTATPGGIGYPMTAGFAAACCALESFARNLASELGPANVRVVNIRSGGSPDSRIFAEAIAGAPELMDSVLKSMKADTMLKKLPLLEDIANTAVFLCSDMARMITGVTVDVTAGTTAALNYRSTGVLPTISE